MDEGLVALKNEIQAAMLGGQPPNDIVRWVACRVAISHALGQVVHANALAVPGLQAVVCAASGDWTAGCSSASSLAGERAVRCACTARDSQKAGQAAWCSPFEVALVLSRFGCLEM